MTPTTHAPHRAPRWTGFLPIACVVAALAAFALLGRQGARAERDPPPQVSIPRVVVPASPVPAAPAPFVCEECGGFAGGPHTTLVGMLGAYAPKSGIGGIESVTFSPDDRVLVAGARDGVMRAWDVVDRRLLWRSERFVGGIASVGFTRDGKSLLVTGQDGSLSEWSTSTGARTRMFYPRDVDGWWERPTIAVTPDGKRALTADAVADRVVVWDLDSGVEVDRITGKPIGGWPAFALDPTGTKFATGKTLSATIDLWDASSKTASRLVEGADSLEGSTRGAAFSPDGKMLATGHWNGVVRLWDVERARARDAWHPHKNVIWQLAFTPDGRLVTGVANEPVSVWNVATKKRELAVEPQGARALAVSGNGKLLATGSFAGWVRVWNLTDGSLAWDPGSDARGVSALDVADDGAKVAIARDDGSAELWASGVRTASIPAVEGARAFALNAATSRVLVEARGGKLVLRALDGTTPRVLREKLVDREREHFVPSVAISRDGRMALEGRIDGRVILRDLDAGTVITTWREHVQSVAALAFSPDGTQALTGETGMLRIGDPSRPLIVWDVANRKKLKELPHNGDVYTVAYASDGQHAVVGRFGAASYWDMAAGTASWGHGKPTDLIIHHVLPPSHVAISPDGRFAASAGADYKLNVFNVATGELIDQRVTMSADDAPTRIAFACEKLFVGTRRGVVLVFALRNEAQAVADAGVRGGQREYRSANTGPDEDCALTCIAPEACVRYYGGMAECLPLCERDADCPTGQVCVCGEGSGMCGSHSTPFVCEGGGKRDEFFDHFDKTAAEKAKRIASASAEEAARRLERGNSVVNATYENGKAREKGQYSLGVESGPWTKWYDDGTKRAEGAFESGRRTGVWRGYYKNGQLWFEGAYREGTMEGPWRSWHRNGNVAAEGSYDQGKRAGAWKQFREDGGLASSAVESESSVMP